MARQKRAKARGAAEPAPLSPEARARLESQVARVVGVFGRRSSRPRFRRRSAPIPWTLTGTPTSLRPWGP